MKKRMKGGNCEGEVEMVVIGRGRMVKGGGRVETGGTVVKGRGHVEKGGGGR